MLVWEQRNIAPDVFIGSMKLMKNTNNHIQMRQQYVKYKKKWDLHSRLH